MLYYEIIIISKEDLTLLKRVDWIDISKGITILLVIIGHNIPTTSLLFKFIFSFHMPLFFIINGYLYKEKNLKSQFKSNFNRLLLPYLFTSFCLVLYTILSALIKNNKRNIFCFIASILYSTGDLVNQFPFLNTIGALWFLTCLFVATILFNFIIKYTKKIKPIYQIAIIIIISFIGYEIGQVIYLPWSIDIALVAQIFLYTGYNLKKYDLLKLKPILLLVTLPIWIVAIFFSDLSMNSRIYQPLLLSIIGAICGTIIIIMISKLLSRINYINKIFSYIGKESLTILCFHLLEHFVFPWKTFYILYNNTTLLILAKILLLLIITYIIKCIPIIKNIFYKNSSYSFSDINLKINFKNVGR